MKTCHKLTLGLLLASAILCVFRSDFHIRSTPGVQSASTPPQLDTLPQPSSLVRPPLVADSPLPPTEDYEPPLSQKALAVIARAIREKWPNVQIRALIAMTRDPGLIAELKGRVPLDVHDWSTLAMYSPTREERWAAAEAWSKADPQNAEPRYFLFQKDLVGSEKKNLKDLIPNLKDILALKECDSYFTDLSVAYDSVEKSCGLENELGLFGMQGGSTGQSPGVGILNTMSEYVKTAEMSVDENIEIAGLAAGLTRQLLDKNALSAHEYSGAISGEARCLLPLDGQTEYGEDGGTVADRIKELKRLFDEQSDIKKICQDAFRENTDLCVIFNQRTQAVGQYEAYRQMYNLIKQSSTESLRPGDANLK